MTRRDPSEWKSSVRRPDDFDEYWRQTEADAMAVPLNPGLNPTRCARHPKSRSSKHVTTAMRG